MTAASISVLSGTSRVPIARYSCSPIDVVSTRPGRRAGSCRVTPGLRGGADLSLLVDEDELVRLGEPGAGVQPLGELRRQRHRGDDQRRPVARADEGDRRLGRARRHLPDGEAVRRLDAQRRRLRQQSPRAPPDRGSRAPPGTPGRARAAPRPLPALWRSSSKAASAALRPASSRSSTLLVTLRSATALKPQKAAASGTTDSARNVPTSLILKLPSMFALQFPDSLPISPL